MCEYCDNNGNSNKKIFEEWTFDVYLSNNELVIDINDMEYYVIKYAKINYCPMCGRKLKED